MHGIIYLATFPNGKMYVGQTTRDLQYRKTRHKNTANRRDGTTVHNAINKYGFENVKWEVIDRAENQIELNKKEMYYIEKLRTYTRYEKSNGYNRTMGGEGVRGIVHSKETRLKFSNSMKGVLSGDKNPSARKVVCLNTGQVFNTMKEASKKYNAPYHHICSCCTGDRLSSGSDDKGNKLVWMYFEDYEKLSQNEINDKIKYAEEARIGENHHWFDTKMSDESRGKMSKSAIERYKHNEHPRVRSIKCITTGEVFKSIADASRHYGILASTISACCTGARKSAGKHPVTGEKMLWEHIKDK